MAIAGRCRPLMLSACSLSLSVMRNKCDDDDDDDDDVDDDDKSASTSRSPFLTSSISVSQSSVSSDATFHPMLKSCLIENIPGQLALSIDYRPVTVSTSPGSWRSRYT